MYIVCTPLLLWQGVDGGDEYEGEEEGGEEGEGEGEEVGEEEVFCVPLESLGLGGNKIGDIGAQHLTSGLFSNNSETSHDLHFEYCVSCDLFMFFM